MPEPAKLDAQVALRAALPTEAAKVVEAAPAKPGPGKLPSEIRAEAEKVRKAVEESPDTSPALTLGEMLRKADSATKDQSDAAIEANIGTETEIVAGEVKKKAPAPGSPEAKRRTDAASFDEINRRIIEARGKIDINHADFAHVKKGLDQLIDASELAYITDPAIRKSLYEAMLQNDDVLRELASGNMDNISKRLEGDAVVVEAKRKAEEAGLKYTAAEAKKKEAEDRVKELEKWEAESKTVPPSGRYADLDGLEGRDLTTEKNDAENVRRIAQDKLNKAEAALQANPTDAALIATRDGHKTARNDAAKEVKRVEDDIAKLRKMKSEISSIPQSLKDARQEKASATTEFNLAQADKAAADSAYSSAILQRTKAETDWVNEKRDIARNAVQKVLDANLDKVNSADSGRLEKMKAEAATELDKHMADFTESRYFKDRDPSIRNSSRKEIKKDEAHRDVLTLMKQSGGAESLVKSALESKYGVGDPRVAEQMKDAEFVKKWGTEMASQAMGIYLRTGGKISPQEGVYLESQEWGKGLIEKGLASNEAVKAMEAKLKEKGLLKSGGFAEFLKRNKGKLAAGAVIALLLSVLTGGSFPGILTGKEGAAGLLPVIQSTLQGAQASLQAL